MSTPPQHFVPGVQKKKTKTTTKKIYISIFRKEKLNCFRKIQLKENS
jgi:hypothetical protein